MTKLLDRAISAARSQPVEVQDDIARVVLTLTGEAAPAFELTDAEAASLAPSQAQADRGEFASDEDVRTLWAKYGL